jgi:hypothetical protein
MSLETYTSLETPTFIAGRSAALRGCPFDEHADDIWKDGWRWGAQEQSERTRPVEPAPDAISVFDLLSAAYWRACQRSPNGENP